MINELHGMPDDGMEQYTKDKVLDSLSVRETIEILLKKLKDTCESLQDMKKTIETLHE
jgi:hypothetical protein